MREVVGHNSTVLMPAFVWSSTPPQIAVGPYQAFGRSFGRTDLLFQAKTTVSRWDLVPTKDRVGHTGTRQPTNLSPFKEEGVGPKRARSKRPHWCTALVHTKREGCW